MAWVERAARVSAEHARAQRKLEGYRQLESDLDDLEALEEMAAEDDSIAGELDEQRATVEARLAGDDLSLAGALRALDTAFVEVDEALVVDTDTPAELRAAARRLVPGAS